MGKDAFEVMEDAEQENSEVYENIRETAEWFHEREGEMFERDEAEKKLQKKLDIEEEMASELISELVSDNVDPVTQVNISKGSFVGIAEYREFDRSYGYIEYDDILGKRKKVVCARCVEKAKKDSEAFHVTADKSNVDYNELVDKINNHYSFKHEKQPEAVKTGATLAAGTTVGGNRVATRNWTKNNNIAHGDLSDAPSSAHHSKTSSASELTDVSADSVSDAHHQKYQNSEARGAVEGTTNVEDLVTSSTTSGEVPTAQGDGTLAMESSSAPSETQSASVGGSVRRTFINETLSQNENAYSDVYAYANGMKASAGFAGFDADFNVHTVNNGTFSLNNLNSETQTKSFPASFVTHCNVNNTGDRDVTLKLDIVARDGHKHQI